MKSKAFTLTEVLIVLSVIGIITAIVIPIAFDSMPNEKIMKFKKANTVLFSAINELVRSDKYYCNGNLATKPDGTYVDSQSYFCETLSNFLSVKSTNCNINDSTGQPHIDLACVYNPNLSENCGTSLLQPASYSQLQNSLDYYCKESIGFANEIVTTDNIHFYETSPSYHFGTIWDQDGISIHFLHEYDNVYRNIKIFCIDLDGGTFYCDDKKDICPFGYGIRVDGKIYMGARAQEWLEKDIQNND